MVVVLVVVGVVVLTCGSVALELLPKLLTSRQKMNVFRIARVI